MDNYYTLLGVSQNATAQDIKKAFRERAKRLHPDIAGDNAVEGMRRLLAAYEILSDRDRRFEYDRAYSRFNRTYHFDYRSFLKEQGNDPASKAKLVFFELLHMEEDTALSIWEEQGGLDFPMEKYIDREDWMDCVYIMAEELARRDRYYEAFCLLLRLIREERRLPYFRHFAEDIENFLKEIVRLRLRPSVEPGTYVECLQMLLDLGFDSSYEARILRSMAEALIRMGELGTANKVLKEALKRDPGLPNTMQLKRKLNIKGSYDTA
ncbi:J domain-containing protein [Leadbettera azotonutricia]|uniref:DnaJ domain protein n=1 Tax=Leadbettera azotonutricia (strain ATCC BAA-888 / DSM 13862 / ZAS-9) TaxID=545695 RepID=F5Y7U9_LEAAZ|nr:J domain-containing protein [Leadbettera azotonutricia]AEF81935.1 DnaJ domain protein [Leadbettera azotonutricia ZAS-9]